MITIRSPDSIYQASGEIEHGTFHGRWHFSFGEYSDPEHMSFGPLRVFNDDTLSPGAVWPLHHHEEIEVVTYCAEGVFRHADENGEGGILKPGWVQHTTVGSGMYHSEINASPNEPMRFIQMWFMPDKPGLKPSVEQKKVEPGERHRPAVAAGLEHCPGSIAHSPGRGRLSRHISRTAIRSTHVGKKGRGAYLYVIEGDRIVYQRQEDRPGAGRCHGNGRAGAGHGGRGRQRGAAARRRAAGVSRRMPAG